jgi:hypothetical protein
MSQSDEERGKLFVQQEKIQKEISQLSSELKRLGSYLRQVGTEITNDPSRATFSNYEGFNLYTSGPLAGMETKFIYGEFKEAMNPENTIKKIILLRTKINELYQVQQKLGNK